jgi:hypothetical protein
MTAIEWRESISQQPRGRAQDAMTMRLRPELNAALNPYRGRDARRVALIVPHIG